MLLSKSKAFLLNDCCTNMWSWKYPENTLQLIPFSESSVEIVAIKPTLLRLEWAPNEMHLKTELYLKFSRLALSSDMTSVRPSSSLNVAIGCKRLKKSKE